MCGRVFVRKVLCRNKTCIYIIKPLVCLSVCLSRRPVHNFGPISKLFTFTVSPWYRDGLNIISRVIGAGTKIFFYCTLVFFKAVKNVRPTDVRPTGVRPTVVCPTGVRQTGVRPTDVCLIGVGQKYENCMPA